MQVHKDACSTVEGMSLSSSYALITGASSGIGAEFARQYAQHGYSLVISGRNHDALENLAQEIRQEHSVDVEIMRADLLREDDVQALVIRIRSAERPVEILVNNAGFGLGKEFLKASAQAHMQQVDVLAKIPLQLMHAALEVMVERGRGRIINVASVAAFMPNGTYSAVKRFVVTMSESAHLQYSPVGVSVTAVCPGLTRSGFHRAMGVDEPQLPAIFWLLPKKVVADAIQANFKNKALVIPSATYKALVFAQCLMPPVLTTAIVGRTRNY